MRKAAFQVFLGGRFVGAYCESHDHPQRTIRADTRKTSGLFDPNGYAVYDAHTGDRLRPASIEMRKKHEVGLPWDEFSGGVKRRLVIRRYGDGGAKR